MSHDDDVPRTPEQPAAFMDGLSFEPAPAPRDEQALLDALPPAGSPVMVVRSQRLPTELDEAVAMAAKAGQVTRAAVETAVSALDFKGITTEVKFAPNGEVAQATINLYEQKSGAIALLRRHGLAPRPLLNHAMRLSR